MYNIQLTEDEAVELANLGTTLRENMEALKQIPDFEAEGSSVGDMVETGLETINRILSKIPM